MQMGDEISKNTTVDLFSGHLANGLWCQSWSDDADIYLVLGFMSVSLPKDTWHDFAHVIQAIEEKRQALLDEDVEAVHNLNMRVAKRNERMNEFVHNSDPDELLDDCLWDEDQGVEQGAD